MLYYHKKNGGLYHHCPNWDSEDAWSEFLLINDEFHCETCDFKFESIIALGSPFNERRTGRFRLIGMPYYLHHTDPDLIKII